MFDEITNRLDAYERLLLGLSAVKTLFERINIDVELIEVEKLKEKVKDLKQYEIQTKANWKPPVDQG